MTKDKAISHYNRLEGVNKIIVDILNAPEKPSGYSSLLQLAMENIEQAQRTLPWSPKIQG